MNGNYISLEAACDFLGVSKPTFNQLRSELKIQVFRGNRRRVFFDKFELIKKIVTKKTSSINLIDLTFTENNSQVSSIVLDDNVFDLRAINLIGPHGALSLLSAICSLVQKDIIVNLIIDNTSACNYLNGIGLFSELDRSFRDKVKWDRSIQSKLLRTLPEVLYPLKVISHKGQDKSVTEKLTKIILNHGFSEIIASYIGWILGELSDNSLTHSKKSPCYILAARYRGETNFLEVGILDSGIGIQNSLKQNPKYSHLSDKEALLTAFKPFVSSWPDNANRGKGLTDVLNISMSNKSFFKVESCNLSIYWSFNDLREEAKFITSMSQSDGVRFCFLLRDTDFELQDKKEIEKVVNKNLEKLK